MRTIILGDVHLGSPLCRASQLLDMLHRVPFDRLVLNGDIFDDLNFRRLRAKHWAVLDRLRLLSDEREIVWICGNHDGSPEALKRLLGVSVLREFTFRYRGDLVWVVHGDQFDDFNRATRGLRGLRDKFYGFAIWFDVPRKTAIQWAQRSSVIFARAAAKVKRKAVDRGREMDAKYVVVGHTHHRELEIQEGITFVNPSSWLASNPSYVLFDETEHAPRLVIMGARSPRSIGRTMRTRVRKAHRDLTKRLSGGPPRKASRRRGH
jgi:UDP-2,3-diacylglucosamine pyrophosphatase LpxH